MNLSDNTILITGGASGIGLALAVRFQQAGSTVIICGRNAAKLDAAKAQYPGLHTYVCDVAREEDRIRLHRQVTTDFPHINVLLNNAGIQHRFKTTEPQDWRQVQEEIAINLEAPIHLALLFLPHLTAQSAGAVINVTSGLAFIPPSFAPVYGATKAGLHSFTISLRHQTEKTGLKVYEIVPPAVNTDLGGPGLHNFGAPLDAFADAMIEGLRNGETEIGFGTSNQSRTASRAEADELSRQMHRRVSGGE